MHSYSGCELEDGMYAISGVDTSKRMMAVVLLYENIGFIALSYVKREERRKKKARGTRGDSRCPLAWVVPSILDELGSSPTRSLLIRQGSFSNYSSITHIL